MEKSPILLIGCGAQAKYALEIFSLMNLELDRIFDPIGGKIGKRLGQHTIESYESLKNELIKKPDQKFGALLCISDNTMKEDIFNITSQNLKYINAIHPKCCIAKTASIGKCNIINAFAVIQPEAEIRNGCMIHAGVIVEHNNRIGSFVNLAPGVKLAGGISIGDRSTLYTGAVVAPNIKIGKDAIIGAGSVVLNDIPDGVMAYGAPAKIINKS